MARIAGVDIPPEKRLEIGLTYVHGIGLATSRKILRTAGLNPDTRVKDLNEEETSRIAAVIQANYKVEGDLRREVQTNIQRLLDIGCYRGTRHIPGVPVRGRRHQATARPGKGPPPAAAWAGGPAGATGGWGGSWSAASAR